MDKVELRRVVIARRDALDLEVRAAKVRRYLYTTG